MADVYTQNQQKHDSIWNVRFLLDTTSITLYCLLYSINSDTVCRGFFNENQNNTWPDQVALVWPYEDFMVPFSLPQRLRKTQYLLYPPIHCHHLREDRPGTAERLAGWCPH